VIGGLRGGLRLASDNREMMSCWLFLKIKASKATPVIAEIHRIDPKLFRVSWCVSATWPAA
jgi:hypothetical protein